MNQCRMHCDLMMFCFMMSYPEKKIYLFPQPNCLTWEWPTISTSIWNSFPKVYIQIQSQRILRMPCQKSQTLWPVFHLSFPSRTLFVATGFHCQEGRRPLGWARGLSVLRPFLHRNLIHQINFLYKKFWHLHCIYALNKLTCYTML